MSSSQRNWRCSDTDKAANYLGLMRKAGRIALGEHDAGAAARAGKACLLLLAQDASDNARKRAEGFAYTAQVPLLRLPYTKQALCERLGKTGCAIAAGDLFAEAKIPAIGTSCTNPQVTLGNDYYFRIAYIDPFQGAVMASYALKNGCKNCVVIVEAGDDYSAGFGNYFSEAMVNGGASCDTVTFQTGETDFSTIMANIKSKGYDGIFAPVSIETAPLIINQAREAGVECQIMAGDTWDDISIAERAGANANGVFFSAFFDASDTSNEAGVEFNKGILEWIAADATRTENNGGAADAISSVTPCGYDAYMAAYNAILAAQSTDGEAIRDALASLEVKGLVTGDLKFDENGDAIKNYVAIKTFQDGKIVFSAAYTG